MFRLYRKLELGEFIVVGGDCSQGGEDSNVGSFLSVNHLDFPLVYKSQGVAAQLTEAIHPVLEMIYDVTRIKPVVAFERQNGGASEMERLKKLNRNGKYDIFVMPKIGIADDNGDDTNKLGWDTTASTRPILIGDWKDAFDSKVPVIYDEDFISQHKTFITNKVGKPVASGTNHDDCVISPAIAWQLYQRVPKRYIKREYERPEFQPSDSVIGI